MSRKTTTAERQHTGGRKLADRHLPFSSLLLMPLAVLGGCLAVNLAVHGNPIAVGLVCGFLGLATAILAGVAYGVGEGRRSFIRWHVVATVIITGVGATASIAIGFNRWWILAFLIAGEVTSCSWVFYRIDALRRDQRDGEVEPDSLRKDLGLEKTRFGKPIHHTDASGQVTRIEVPVQHGPGQTVDVIQAAVPGIESIADAPRGRSRAVPGEGAGRSNLVIITKDVLAEKIPWPGPSAPGACITAAPLRSGLHEDQQPAVRFVAGDHPDAENPASTGWMGMTRTGKTLDAQVDAMDMMTRRNVVMHWIDKVKGAQTVDPLRPGLDIIVGDDNPQSFKRAVKAYKHLITYRTNRLGQCGYRSWNRAAAEDPRLRMPLLYGHFEEADVLCDICPDDLVFLASKGLSAGLVLGVSLQRADATSMPTGLRFNIGNWKCFGCGDDYSAGFALSDATIAAGAHPENWKQSKPGYHYREGIGVPEQRWPVVARSFYVDDDEIAQHARLWGPRMTPLDAGSVAALGDWYTTTKATMAAARRDTVTVAPTPAPAPPVDDEAAEIDTIRTTITEEIAEMRTDGTIPPQLDPEAEALDPRQPIPEPADTGEAELTWRDDRAAAPTPEAALDAFGRALLEVAADTELRDQDQPDTVVFQVGDLVDRYKFRSRPWFSEILTKAVDGDVELPAGLQLSRGDKAGQYRIERLATVSALPHAQ